MKRLYIEYDFSTNSCGIRGHFDGVKGYSIVNHDGSCDPNEYMEALNRIMYVLKHAQDTVLITFGDGSGIADGSDLSYGRLIRHWGGGKLGYVIWDNLGNRVTLFENEDGAVPDRKLARSFLDTMLERHKRVCGMETDS